MGCKSKNVICSTVGYNVWPSGKAFCSKGTWINFSPMSVYFLMGCLLLYFHEKESSCNNERVEGKENIILNGKGSFETSLLALHMISPSHKRNRTNAAMKIDWGMPVTIESCIETKQTLSHANEDPGHLQRILIKYGIIRYFYWFTLL